jgi:hypothetical protein
VPVLIPALLRWPSSTLPLLQIYVPPFNFPIYRTYTIAAHVNTIDEPSIESERAVARAGPAPAAGSPSPRLAWRFLSSARRPCMGIMAINQPLTGKHPSHHHDY